MGCFDAIVSVPRVVDERWAGVDGATCEFLIASRRDLRNIVVGLVVGSAKHGIAGVLHGIPRAYHRQVVEIYGLEGLLDLDADGVYTTTYAPSTHPSLYAWADRFIDTWGQGGAKDMCALGGRPMPGNRSWQLYAVTDPKIQQQHLRAQAAGHREYYALGGG